MQRNWLVRFGGSFSTSGFLAGTLFLAASLTPTLLPRTALTQGALSGSAFAVGYGIGVFGRWLWTNMELPRPQARVLHIVGIVTAAICAFVATAFLWQAAPWQNSIRVLMGLEPVGIAYSIQVGLIALATFMVLIVLARLFRLTLGFISMSVNRFVPRRVSNVIGFVAAIALSWSIINGAFIRIALQVANSSYEELDALFEPESEQPVDPIKTGSSVSLLEWDQLGRAGREFIASGPTGKDIGAFTGKDALEPIRVYVGLRSAETTAERAKLALEELKRVGGFKRGVLIVVTPTGTGWMDPAAMDTIEYLHRGDVASVALQYSYIGSWLYLLTGGEYGADASRALFKEVYGYWTTLPKNSRPRLYLFGISLGALYSQQSTDLIEVFGDPFNGALWSGPPYSSRLWTWVTANRNPGSPVWLPRFRDGSFVRFMNQEGPGAGQGAAWGPMRIVYLQYASDPVTFFDYHYLYREPAWMSPPRGPDVSPQLRWFPVVTVVQLWLDMGTSTAAPIGFGHVYAPEHYIDAWIDVTDVRGWSPQEIARLKRHLRKPQ